MKGGVFDNAECCNTPCECPVCLENKPLMRLNCNHYVCQADIQSILSNLIVTSRVCPICRTQITSYGCNGNIVNVMTAEEGDTDEESSDENMYGGKLNKRKRTNKKTVKKSSKRKNKTRKQKKSNKKTSKKRKNNKK